MDRCVRFKEGLLFRRVDLKNGFFGSIVKRKKDNSQEMLLNREGYIFLDLFDSGRTVDQSIDFITEYTGVDRGEVAAGAEKIVEELLANGFAELVQSEKIEGAQNVVPETLVLQRYDLLEGVTIQLLSGCNLKCKHCYGEYGIHREERLSKEVVFKLLDQLSALHCENVNFTGGEVMLHEDFYEILEYAAEKNFILSFLTNGTLIDREFAERVGNIGNIHAQLSLDGHYSELHDDFRGVKGAFLKTVSAVKYLKEAGLSVSVTAVVNRKNMAFIREIERFVEDMGVGFKYGAIYKAGNAQKCGENYYITPEEYYKVISDYKEGEKKYSNESSKSEYVERCGAGTSRFCFRASGNVSPCEVLPDIERFTIATVYDPIDRWLCKVRGDDFFGSMNAMDLEQCGECKLVDACKGGCVATSFIECGKTDVQDPFFCAMFSAEAGQDYKMNEVV